MRILKIVPEAFYTARGTPLSAYHRARELLLRGHEVDILTYGIGEPPPRLSARVFRTRGPHFCRSVRAGLSAPKIWLDVLLFASLSWRLCRERYDALYAHEEAALLARIAGALFRIPYVYDMHSSLVLQITEREFSNRRVVAFLRWIERVCVSGACAIVAVSPAVARAARRAWPDALCIVLPDCFEAEDQEKSIVQSGSVTALQARLRNKSSRDAAYEEIASAIQTASELQQRPTMGLFSSHHTSSHRH